MNPEWMQWIEENLPEEFQEKWRQYLGKFVERYEIIKPLKAENERLRIERTAYRDMLECVASCPNEHHAHWLEMCVNDAGEVLAKFQGKEAEG